MKHLHRPLVVTSFIVLLLGCILVFPKYLVERGLQPGDANRLTPAERLKAENDVRTTLLQGLGGLLLVVGAIVTWRQLQLSRQQVELNRDQFQQNIEANRAELHLSREGQITERFTRAIDHLGSDKLEIRLGGIYAVERIARNSQKDHWPVMEVLTAYLREHVRWRQGQPLQSAMPEKRPPDIEAILTVLRRRERSYGNGEEDGLDLRACDLRGVNLTGAYLQGAYLTEAHLEGAILKNAHLEGASLKNAHLERANLRNSDLKRTSLLWAKLKKADLTAANLEGADLRGADVRAQVIKQQIDLATTDHETQLPEWVGEHVIVLPTD